MRNCGLTLMVAGATCLLVVSAAWAAEVPPAGPADLHPYVVVADAPPIHVTSLDAAVVRRQAVKVNVAGLAEWTGGKGTRLRFDLFDGLSVVGIVDKADRPSKDQLTWSGRLDTEAWGRFTFVLRDGICTAIIRQADHKALYVRPLPDGGHVLDELEEEQFDGCGADDVLAEGIAPQLRQVTGDRQAATDDGTLFDLMVVYTPAAREGAGGTAAMLALIDLAVANSNQAFANSEIVPRIRLVHTVEVDYLESGSGGTDLGRLRDPADGYMDEVHTLRDEYGADLVCMINDTMPGLCGLAFVMTEESPAFAASAFSVVRRNCAYGTSFVHELGHNMGCLHDRDHASACGFGYVYGYRDPVSASWRTVMAYSPGSPIPFFSNPDVLYNGQPTGAALDQAKPTCNARTINTTARTVANWRPQAESVTPARTSDESDALPRTREAAGVVFVDAQATGNNTGTSWADAFVDFQDALAEAADPAGGISEVWVAAGTYHPDRSTGDRFASFRLVSGVGVYGGFVGGETQREDRDPSTHQTILSGDLWQNDQTGGHPYENSGHVVVAEDVDHTAVLDGFTITAGYNLNLSWSYDGGGGMAVVNASPTVSRCRFVDNAGPKGGALMIVSGSPTFANCGFHTNLSGPIGGAVYNQDGTPLFLSCLFTGNMTTNCELVPTGGAFYSRGGYPRVVNCTFWGNTATMGRSFAAQGDANLTNCILWDDEPVEGVASLSRQIVGSGVELSFSCVRGWTSTMEGVGNHGLDPLFVDPFGPDHIGGTADDDLRLNAGSPCIDAGSMEPLPPPDLGDLAGEVRIRHCRVDLGAYESSHFRDCNMNGLPDGCDIVAGTDFDCNHNAVLDVCEVVWQPRVFIAGEDSSQVLAYTSSGALIGEFLPSGTPGVVQPVDMVIDSRRNVYLACVGSNRVLRYAAPLGSLSREYADPAIDHPTALLVRDTATLLVASGTRHSIVELDADTGRILRELVEPGSGGLSGPVAMYATYDTLYVASWDTDQVLKYDIKTGELLGIAAEGHGLSGPAGLMMDSRGYLLVSSYHTDAVLAFDKEGQYRGPFIPAGSAGLSGPGRLRYNITGSLAVLSKRTGQVLDFNAQTGAPADRDPSTPGPQPVFVTLPGHAVPVGLAILGRNECDGNGIPDACQIADGSSEDCNENGIPDHCESDTDGDGIIDACDPDIDDDGILDDGNGDSVRWNKPCTGGQTVHCDDNCPYTPNPDQADINGDGIGDACTPPPPVFVDADATGNNDGSSWQDAYADLQDALDAARQRYVPAIWVAAGTYRPDRGTGDRVAAFELPGGLAIYGGFAGSETELWQRNPQLHATVLAGDLAANDRTADPGRWLDNSFHVVTAIASGHNAVLDGFTITGGRADGPSPHDRGAGLHIRFANPVLIRCRFVDNHAALDGGAVYATQYSHPAFLNCAFELNTAGRHGGAAMHEEYTRPTLANCGFVGNRAVAGGAIHNSLHANAELVNCTLAGNHAETGGGIYNHTGEPSLVNCIVWGNTDSAGIGPAGQITDIESLPRVSYSCIQDGLPGDGWVWPGTDNTDLPPRFIRSPDDGGDGWGAGGNDDLGDLRLLGTSPAIDAGLTTALPRDTWDIDHDDNRSELLPLDLGSHHRVVDAPAVPDTGPGSPPIVDMGAHEYYPDCNDNGVPDDCDVDCGSPGGPCDVPGCGQSTDCDRNRIPDECEADVDGDGIPDVCEFVYGDFDLDGDVDLDDFGLFQACLSGSRVPPADNPVCRGADLDRDVDVDANDLWYLRQCLTGQGIPANPHCGPWYP